jgi:hypothetical protein
MDTRIPVAPAYAGIRLLTSVLILATVASVVLMLRAGRLRG